jgi:tetratricopeptide (TPR) repeat protein
MKYSLLFLLTAITLISCEPVENNDSDSIIVPDTTAIVIQIDSLDFLTNQINSNVDNADFRASRAKYFLRIGNISDALMDMQSAVRLDSNNTTYRNYYGDLLITTLDLDNAMLNYEYTLSIDSSNAKAYVGIGHIYALVNNPGLATGFLNKAYQIDPYLSEAYFLEGLIYRSDFYETGRDESWDRAISSFQTAVEQNPNYYSAYIEMGVMHDEQDHDIALEYYNTAIAIRPNSTEAWYNKGMFFQNKGKYEEAKTCYRTISSIDSLYTESYYNQGYINLVYEKQLDSSIFFFNKTVEIDSLHFYAYNNLGLSYERNGEIDLAQNAYKKAIEINPDFKLAKKNLNLLN